MQDEESAILHERIGHRLDELPPKFAETGVEPPGFRIESEAQHRQVLAELGTKVDRATIRAAGQVPGVRRLIANTLREARRAAKRLRATSRRPVTKGASATDPDEAASA